MQTQPVALERCRSYEDVGLALDRLLSHLGGLGRHVAGRDVLIKPNFLSAHAPDRAVTTHPAVICAVAKAALEAGAKRVRVGDSPAVVRAERVALKLGLPGLLAPLGVSVIELTAPISLARSKARYPELALAREVVEAEVVLNVAKLKTHGLCGLTMAVKNCFGAVVGLGKARWHLRAGRDQRAFADLLTDICRAVRPALSIVDAVIAMDGNGPGSGRPRTLGLLAASEDPFALDRVLARTCGVRASEVATFACDGLDGATIPLAGETPEAFAVRDWQMPKKARPIETVVRAFLPERLIRDQLAPPPHFDRDRCNLCKQCVEICPGSALTRQGVRIRLDSRACIRCYCCQEICPEGAIAIRPGLLQNLIR